MLSPPSHPAGCQDGGGTSPAEALRHHARERAPEGARPVGAGRGLGRAQVEPAPDRTTMGQASVDAWCRATLAGTSSCLYTDTDTDSDTDAD